MSSLTNKVSTIYNKYIPQYGNIYTVFIFNKSSDGNLSSDIDMSDYVELHAKQVSFGEYTLNTERDPVTKNYKLAQTNPMTWYDQLSITWQEDYKFSVKKFHQDWISNFYDFDNDVFISGTKNKFKTFKIVVSNDFDNLSLSTDLGSNKVIFEFNDVIPVNSSELKLGWTNSPSITEYTLNYKVKEFNMNNLYSLYSQSLL